MRKGLPTVLHPHNALCIVACVFLSHMLFHQKESFFNYIGVAILCRRGCFHLTQSANFANGTRFATKGCHHKWYYPWKFPPVPETTRNVVVELVYTDPANLFANTSAGFRPKTGKTLYILAVAGVTQKDRFLMFTPRCNNFTYD